MPDDGDDSLFGDRPLRVELLTNRTTAQPSAGGSSPAWPPARSTSLIGTHALIQEGVEFRRSASS